MEKQDFYNNKSTAKKMTDFFETRVENLESKRRKEKDIFYIQEIEQREESQQEKKTK